MDKVQTLAELLFPVLALNPVVQALGATITKEEVQSIFMVVLSQQLAVVQLPVLEVVIEDLADQLPFMGAPSPQMAELMARALEEVTMVVLAVVLLLLPVALSMRLA